jgi:hypothetical protein
MIVKYVTEKVSMPVRAGMEYLPGTGKIINYKFRTIGKDIFLHTYAITDDGDKQFFKSEKIKRVFFKR